MTGPRIYPDNTAVSRTPRAAPGLLDLLRSLLQKGQEGAEAVEQRIASGLPEGTLRGTIPEYIEGPGGAPKIVGKVGEQLKQVLGVRPTSVKLRDTEDLQKKMSLFFRPPATKAFDDWLGRSKLINQVGDPKPLFHGTDRALDVIEPRDRRLIFTAGNTPVAESYAVDAAIRNRPGKEGPQVYPLYGRMERPLDMSRIPHVPGPSDDPALYEALEQFGLTPKQRSAELANEPVWRILQRMGIDRDRLQRGGFDGTILNDVDYDGRPHLSYAFTDPNQLKSAIGNSGAFSRNSNNIALGLAGLTTAASTRNRDKP